MKVAIFARVSTKDGRQDNGRQVNDLQTLCNTQGWTVAATVTETISGAKKNDQREGLQEVMRLAASGAISKVVVTEVSRLGRKVGEVIQTIEQLAALKVSIYIGNIGMETLLHDGKENFMFKPILVTLAGFAEMERELLRERILSGMETAKKKGKTFGRPTGSGESLDEVTTKYPVIVKHLKKGRSIRETAKLAGVAPATVQKVKKALAA
jgi:DNA invertase Pin-like site-specific DNA recombinase